MSNQNVSVYQKLALGDEVRTSINLIKLGLGELQKISGSNDFYFLPFSLLSSGFERLMKCMICLKYYDDNRRFPSSIELKRFGHNLMDLKNKIINDCISTTTIQQRQATIEDYDFLTQDQDLNKLIEILSEFGKGARYYNLDIITGNNTTPDIKKQIEDYETKFVLESQELTNFFNNKEIDLLYSKIYKIIISKIERFVRALTRQFTLGDLGNEAKKFTGIIMIFLKIQDNQLGEIDYCNIAKHPY